jgi:hypothetical protein
MIWSNWHLGWPWLCLGGGLVLFAVMFGTYALRGHTTGSRWWDPVWLAWLTVPMLMVHMFEEYGFVRIISLGDVSEPCLTTGRVLGRHKPQPDGELTPVLEVMTVADGGDEGRGGDGTYALTGLRAAGELVVAHSEANLPFILQHLSG